MDFKNERFFLYFILFSGVSFGVLVRGWGYIFALILVLLGEFAARALK